jgi:hypothetical protein
VEELKVFVLNLLSPLQRVFWSFGRYGAVRRGSNRVSHTISGRSDTKESLVSMLAELGGAKTFFSHVLLGGLTRPFGDRFEPDSLEADYFLLSHRQDSIAVPTPCRPAVARYFQRLITVFGEDSTRPCDEHHSLARVGGGPEQAAELLAVPVEMMGKDQLHKLHDEVRQIGFSYINWVAGRDFEFAYGNQGGITVRLMRNPDPSSLNEISAILRFRVNVATIHCALPVVEQLKEQLDAAGWSALALADLREELRGILDARLSKYPIYQTDPFEAWLRTGSPKGHGAG